MFHEFPYTNFSEMNLDWLICMCKKNEGLHLAIQGDYLRLLNGNNEVISSVKVSYADKALTDIDGKEIQTYIFDAGVNGTTLVFTHGDNTVTTITVPYADKAKYDIDNHEIEDYIYNVQLAGDKVRITHGDGTISEITIPFATRAKYDDDNNDIETYACSLEVDGDTIVLRDRKGRLLNSIIVPYATKALQDGSGNTITATYGNSLDTGTTTVSLIAKDGTILDTITVPYATEASHATNADNAILATDATNAIESVTIVGDKVVFTTYGGTQTEITVPYSVKAQKDDLGNVIKSTYVANVTANNNTGEISFLDAQGNTIVTIVPQVEKAKKDSYNNLIADYVKQILVDSQSNYVTVVHGTGATDTLTINYSTHAFKDINDQAIHNTYITYMECVEDVVDGHYKLVCYNGDIPKAELFRFEVIAYMAQCDVNERELTTYVGDVRVDENDDKKLNVLDGEDAVKNVILATVDTEPSGTVSSTASGTGVTLTAGTLPSLTYDSNTEALTFSAGTFPTVSSVTDPTITSTFTGDSATNDVEFTDSY